MIHILFALMVGCAHKQHQFKRSLSDDAVAKIAAGIIELRMGGFTASVNWSDCRYHVVIWPHPVTPDTQRIFTLDETGKVISGPRGTHEDFR